MKVESHLDAMPEDLADIDIMARTAWGEARGEGAAGMQAICHVIMNRVARAGWMGKSIREVCLKPFQFSCWNIGDPNREKVENVTPSDPQFAEALEIAGAVIRGELPDNTGGAAHYHADYVKPAWADQARVSAYHSGHVFYTGIA